MTKDAWEDQGFAENWDEAGNLFTNPDRLNQLALISDLLAGSGASHLVDLGIGSAQVESVLNHRHPDFFGGCSVTGIDASEAMLELAEQRCAAEGLSEIKLLQGDFGSINGIALDHPPDAVICVQALHEVPHDVKKQVFSTVRNWLTPGKPFYILDRFEYPEAGPKNGWLDDWRATWNWMRSTAPREVLEFDQYHRQYCAKTDHIASVQEYRIWLERAGFETVCPYQCFNRALIIARA